MREFGAFPNVFFVVTWTLALATANFQIQLPGESQVIQHKTFVFLGLLTV